MNRAALFLLLLTPADYTVCVPVPTGPIVSQKPVQPFVRKPDEAAVNSNSGFGTTTDDDWPPMRFRKIGTATVNFAEQDQIDRLCGRAPFPWQTEACANNARIVLPDPC